MTDARPAVPPMLAVSGLCVGTMHAGARMTVVEDVSFEIAPGGRFALVGESGSGKSMTALAVAGLLPGRFRILDGSVSIDGKRTGAGSGRAPVRGLDVAMVFQDPMSALNPVMPIGRQLTEAILAHSRIDADAARRRAVELLDQVQISGAAQRLRAYPHEFSGGMRQRVMIAMALANRPKLLIADEPTTALDVTTQLQILRLLDELCRIDGAALLLITHDLGIVQGLCDEVAVLYSGKIMETGPVERILAQPTHPYTRGLIRSMPPLDAEVEWLEPIPGEPPAFRSPLPGCPFAPRCASVADICREVTPPLVASGTSVRTACHFVGAADAETTP